MHSCALVMDGSFKVVILWVQVWVLNDDTLHGSGCGVGGVNGVGSGPGVGTGTGTGGGEGGSVGGGVGAGAGLMHPALQSLLLLYFPIGSSAHVYLLSSHLNIFGVGLGVGFGLGPG
jgi:hypothetical protein